jgi:hypothetical protein
MRQRFVEAGRERVREKFGLDRMIDEYEKAIGRVVS